MASIEGSRFALFSFALAFVTTIVADGNVSAQVCADQLLCQSLATIQPEEQRPVVLGGVYAKGPESRVLYAVGCTMNVQPVTWIEFSPDAIGLSLLEQIKGTHEARVVFKGTLHGPRRPSNIRDITEIGRLQAIK